MRLAEYLARFAAQRIHIIGPQPLTEALPIVQPVIWVDGGVRHRPPITKTTTKNKTTTPAATTKNETTTKTTTTKFGFAVGDGDSSTQQLDEYLPRAKDFSDLAYALRALPPAYCELILLGLLGGRRDHELFNLGEAHHFLARAKSKCRLRFDHMIYGYSAGEWRLCVRGGFSLASLARARVKLRGACEYKLTKTTSIAPLASIGLSNRGFGEIILTTDSPAFIFCDNNATTDG